MSEARTFSPAAPVLSGTMFIGHKAASGCGPAFRALAALDGAPLEPPFANAMAQDVEQACLLAAEAFDAYRSLPLDLRAGFIEAIAQEILDLGDVLIERAMAETGLPRPRLEGERGRTVGQLRMFAEVVRQGDFLGVRIDPALPDRTPLPRPDLRLVKIPLGPVAVFGASNFPLAFSVAGGDTASALAAGCPVVVKGHPAHPGTSELVAGAVVRAAQRLAMPEGVFSYLVSDDPDIAQGLVADPRIKAIGFTGSRAVGMAIYRTAHARAQPVPVYAEMSAINPVLLMSGALAKRAESIADAFVAALTMGAGQFCTNPGLVLAIEGPELDRFLKTASGAIAAAEPGTMLTQAIRSAYEQALGAARAVAGVECLSEASRQEPRASAALLAVDADTFLAAPTLQEEMFGPASLVVRCKDLAQLAQ